MAMTVNTLLGRGIVTPFKRKGGDIANVSGAPLVESALKQILRTRKGELRWRPKFGITLDTHRQQNMGEVLEAQVQSDILEGIASFEPRAEIIAAPVARADVTDTVLRVRLTWRAKTQGGSRNTVLTGEFNTEVSI